MASIGKTSGLFFAGTFIYRFCIEFLKAPQSALLAPDAVLDMGQWLSLPLILVGIVLFFHDKERLRSGSVKGE
jgi:phosphatidylglycerol---prolipoprotein diacylglyceryl transferase